MASAVGKSEKSGKFGSFVRRQRNARGIGLRQMAKMIGVSPAYLSQFERGEFAPPSEEKIRAIALVLEHHPDELLAMSGRVPSDVVLVVEQNPVAAPAVLRRAKELGPEGLEWLSSFVCDIRDEKDQALLDAFREWMRVARASMSDDRSDDHTHLCKWLSSYPSAEPQRADVAFGAALEKWLRGVSEFNDGDGSNADV